MCGQEPAERPCGEGETQILQWVHSEWPVAGSRTVWVHACVCARKRASRGRAGGAGVCRASSAARQLLAEGAPRRQWCLSTQLLLLGGGFSQPEIVA